MLLSQQVVSINRVVGSSLLSCAALTVRDWSLCNMRDARESASSKESFNKEETALLALESAVVSSKPSIF